MTERDAVDQLLELAVSGLAPSPADKQRHRRALARSLASDGTGTSLREAAPSPTRGWAALRASGGAGWSTGALLLGAGVGLGFWLHAAIDARPARQQPAPAPPAAAVEATAAGVAPPSAPPALPAQRSEATSASEPAPDDAPTDPATGSTTGIESRRPSDAAKPTRRAPRHRAANQRPPSGIEASRVEASVAPSGIEASVAPSGVEASVPPSGIEASDAPSGVEPVVTQPFDEELALLQRVERALRGDGASLALALLDELDERFPQTRLGEERRAARHVAECQLELPESSRRAERFLAERSSSVYAHRVRAACTPKAE